MNENVHTFATSNKNSFFDNWKVGCMWIEKMHHTKNYFSTYDVLRWWDSYDTKDCQYFRPNIVNRYKDMKPFE